MDKDLKEGETVTVMRGTITGIQGRQSYRYRGEARVRTARITFSPEVRASKP